MTVKELRKILLHPDDHNEKFTSESTDEIRFFSSADREWQILSVYPDSEGTVYIDIGRKR